MNFLRRHVCGSMAVRHASPPPAFDFRSTTMPSTRARRGRGHRTRHPSRARRGRRRFARAAIEMVEPMGSDLLAWCRLGGTRSRCGCRPRRRSSPAIDPARGFRPTSSTCSTPPPGADCNLRSIRNTHDTDRRPFVSALFRAHARAAGGAVRTARRARLQAGRAVWRPARRSAAAQEPARRARHDGAELRMSASTGCAPIPSTVPDVPGSRRADDFAPAPPLGERDGGEAEWRALGRELAQSARSSPPKG